MSRFCIDGGQGEYPLASSFATILPPGRMVSKCGCVMTHPMLGILLANRFRFAGSACLRAGGFEPITPYPAIALMLLYCGGYKGKIKTATVRAHGCTGIFSSFGVLCANHNRKRYGWQYDFKVYQNSLSAISLKVREVCS